jgi:TetR/AcrR family transcriptional regulator, regulator of cefoperazone and chloramphenicol sensitivity
VTERPTKDRLLDAAERLFARDGVHGARIREINELAGARNPSALHYHFGSRGAVVEAILKRYQRPIDEEVAAALDALEATGRRPTEREVIEAVVRPEVATLETQSGRDCVRIIPQLLPALSRNLRAGVVVPTTPESRRILTTLDERMAERSLPEHVRRERLVTYAVVFTTMLGERAHALEEGARLLIAGEEFAVHMIDVLEALLVAPSSVPERKQGRP